MRKIVTIGLALSWILVSSPVGAEPRPDIPRNGLHTVQAMMGGRTVIPLCIVAPREYVDGTEIRRGTDCTIVVYRSMDEGKPGTYTQEVGRGQGPIEREWIDVGADAPCDDPNGGVIYLASCAVINGAWSDLNNKYLTITWSPGEFSVKEYPAAGQFPGPPPGQRAATPPSGPEQYPAWLKEIGDAARGVGGAGGDGGYTVETLPLQEYHDELAGLELTLTMRIAVAADGTLSGDTDLEPLLVLINDLPFVDRAEALGSHTIGRLAGGQLSASAAFAITIHTEVGGQRHARTIRAYTTFTGAGQQGDTIRGQARTTVSYSGEEEGPAPNTRGWDFVAEPQGEGGMRLAVADTAEGSDGPVPSGFHSAAMKQAGSADWASRLDDTMGSISLSVGDSHFFDASGRSPRVWWDPNNSEWVGGATFTRVPGDQTKWYAGPSGVLKEEPVGQGVRVRAIGNGMGEVCGRTRWTYTMPDGRSGPVGLLSYWIVPVGGEALAKLKGGQGETGGDDVELGDALASVEIKGNAVLKGPGRTPVPGATVSLIYLPTGGAYEDPSWVTDEQGKIRIAVGARLLPGEYEVMVQKRNRDTAVIGPDEDLWPMRRYIINVTAAAAKAGPIAVGTSIKMDRVKNIDFNLRDRRPVRAGAE